MAKLNGVQTIDMVNGEITKVAYGGAEYAKVAHDFKDALTGDIFLNDNNGNYYEITIRESDFYGVPHPVRFKEDDGRDNGYMRACSIHPLFRKISAQATPTIADVNAKVDGLAERVGALEVGKQAEELRVGDREEIVDKRASEYTRPSRITTGKITDIDFGEYFAEYPYRVDSDGTYDRFPASALRKVADKPKAEPLKVGDYAKVVGLTGGSARHNGKIVELTKRWDMNSARFNVASIVEDNIASCDEGNLVRVTFEEVAEEKAKAEASAEQARKDAIFTQAGRKPNEYREGDIVRVIKESNGHDVGIIGEVSMDEITARPDVKARHKDGRILALYSYVEPITFVESRLDRN